MNDTRIEPNLQKAFPDRPHELDGTAGGVARAPLTTAPPAPSTPPAPPAANASLSVAHDEAPIGRGDNMPNVPRMGRGHHDVPPPGVRIPRHVREAKPALGTLPPGGRRATLVQPASAPPAGRPSPAAASGGAARPAAETGARGAAHKASIGGAAASAATPGRRADDHLAAAGAAAGAAVWSARQGAAERPKSDWATPVGATTHPEFNPTPTSTDAWPGEGEEPAQATARVKGPVLWGIVLLIAAALTFIALWIKGNIATERDLAALARFAHIPSAPTEETVPRAAPQPVLPAPAEKPEQVIAQAPAPVAPGTPMAPAGNTGPESAANRVAETPRTVQPIEARPPAAQTTVPVRQQARQVPAQVRRPAPAARNIAAAPPSPDNAIARMSPRAKEYLYSRVFRRCPAPGAPGALQCRKHICNGAEGRSPACYHINRLNL